MEVAPSEPVPHDPWDTPEHKLIGDALRLYSAAHTALSASGLAPTKPTARIAYEHHLWMAAKSAAAELVAEPAAPSLEAPDPADPDTSGDEPPDAAPAAHVEAAPPMTEAEATEIVAAVRELVDAGPALPDDLVEWVRGALSSGQTQFDTAPVDPAVAEPFPPDTAHEHQGAAAGDAPLTLPWDDGAAQRRYDATALASYEEYVHDEAARALPDPAAGGLDTAVSPGLVAATETVHELVDAGLPLPGELLDEVAEHLLLASLGSPPDAGPSGDLGWDSSGPYPLPNPGLNDPAVEAETPEGYTVEDLAQIDWEAGYLDDDYERRVDQRIAAEVAEEYRLYADRHAEPASDPPDRGVEQTQTAQDLDTPEQQPLPASDPSEGTSHMPYPYGTGDDPGSCYTVNQYTNDITYEDPKYSDEANPHYQMDDETRGLFEVADTDPLTGAPLRWPTAEEWEHAGVPEGNRSYTHTPDEWDASPSDDPTDIPAPSPRAPEAVEVPPPVADVPNLDIGD